MPLVTFIAVYVLIWALVLQALLPFGIKSQAESGEIVEGTDPGAPVRPRWLRKMLAATLISLALSGACYWMVAVIGLGPR